MPSLAQALRATIYFSVALGAVFLWEARPLLPSDVFYFVATGWALFVADAVLTLYRPDAAYALAAVLALLALVSALPQSAHYAFIEERDLLPAATFILGSASQVLILIIAPTYFARRRRAPRRAAATGSPS